MIEGASLESSPMSIRPPQPEELMTTIGLTGEAVTKKIVLGTGQMNNAPGGAQSGQPNIPYKVREFEWFEIETKVRKFVNELLQPTVKRIALDKRMLEEIRDQISTNDEQVKGLYDFIHYTHNRVKVLDDIHEKIARTNTGLEIAGNRHKQSEDKVQVFQENVYRELNTIRQEVGNVLKSNHHKLRDGIMKEQLSQDRITLVEYFENFKKNTSEVIAQLQKELTDSQSSQKTEFMRTWDSIFKVQTTQQTHSADLVSHQDKMNELFVKINAIRVKNTGYDNTIEQMEKNIEVLQADIGITKKFANKVEDLSNQFRLVENYVEKYNQLYVQGQISDTLFNCFDRAMKKKLVQYDEKVFATMNSQILLDNGDPNLGKKIEESIGFVESITKRNAKFFHNSKKQSTVLAAGGIMSSIYTSGSAQEGSSDQATGTVIFDGNGSHNNKREDNIQKVSSLAAIPELSNQHDASAINDDNIVVTSPTEQRRMSIAAYENYVSHIPGGGQNQAAGTSASAAKHSGKHGTSTNGTIAGASSSSASKTQQQQHAANTVTSLKKQESRISVNSNGSNSDDDEYNQTTRKLKAFVDGEVKKMRDIIEKKTWSLQKGLQESEELLSVNVTKVQDDMEKGINLLRKQHNNVVLETNQIDAKIVTIWAEITKIAKTFNILSETVHKLIHFNSLVNALALQDELDRQTVALYGANKPPTLSDDSQQNVPTRPSRMQLRSSSNNVNVNNATYSQQQQQQYRIPIQLDTNCNGCAGQLGHQVLQTFKIACLTYAPSTVQIDGQDYKRDEVLEVTSHLLRAARQHYGLKSQQGQSSNGMTDIDQQSELVVLLDQPIESMQKNQTNSSVVSAAMKISQITPQQQQHSSSHRVNTVSALSATGDHVFQMYSQNPQKHNSMSSVYNQLTNGSRSPGGSTLPSLDSSKQGKFRLTLKQQHQQQPGSINSHSRTPSQSSTQSRKEQGLMH